MSVNPIPDLIDNQTHTVSQVLKSLLAQTGNPRLDVVTAFFNLKGLDVLEPEIQQLVALRLLLGKEQEQAFVVGEHLRAELEDTLSRAKGTMAEIARWRDFLAQEKVQIRRYVDKFLHGKAYIIHGVPTLGAVGIVGSSNFTGAGLTTNRELNAVLKQSSAVRELQQWFESHWAEAENYKAELLALLEQFTPIYTPYEIYIKVLYEALRDQLDQDLAETGEKPSPIALADFQHDGYLAAKEILENYNGVLIADSVGLGKTYLALRLLDDYAYRERQMALIVCPAAIRDTVWRPLLQRFAIPYELVSMEEVSRREFPVDHYARRFKIIVVDESHNFRNPNTNRWTNLFRLITSGDSNKKVILLTATPVNNTVFDLYHQLRLITRDNRRFLLGAGIRDLWEHFRRAEQNKDALYEVLEALAVRRSRHFIRQNYPHAEVDGQPIRFPEREIRTVHYSLKETYGPGLYRQIASAIEELFLAPYQVDMYRKALVEARRFWATQTGLPLFELLGESEQSAVQRLKEALGWSEQQAHEFLLTVGRQAGLAHILRVLYLKRLESSVEALRISLDRLYRFLSTFLQALEAGRLLSSGDFRRWLASEASDDEREEDVSFEAFLQTLPELPEDKYDVQKIRAAVETDLKTVGGILQALERRPPDTKLERLKSLLSSDELRSRKVVVFSYFKDTARYLFENLKQDPGIARRGIALVDSDVKPSERVKLISRFAPRANGRPDLAGDEEINVLISTDVLSEGQNLQDADVVVDYDLHWNPVRMVQRVGRLDRLGSPHERIYVYNFFPESELEELLGLVKRLYEKLDAINRTVGLDASILGETPNPMNFNILRRLEREDASVLEELEAESELTVGEFLKQDLLRFLKEVGEAKLKHIPLGVGTARKRLHGPRGFFAAFRNPRTNQHHWLFYDREKDRIIDRRLDAIRLIRCEPSEPPHPLTADFDPRPLIRKLRRHLWNRIRAAVLAPGKLPQPQRQIVNWLRALPPSAQRNHLLGYFEAGPLVGPDLKELQRIWRNRSARPPEEWLDILQLFVETHPRQPATNAEATASTVPESDEELECIAWMAVE